MYGDGDERMGVCEPSGIEHCEEVPSQERRSCLCAPLSCFIGFGHATQVKEPARRCLSLERAVRLMMTSDPSSVVEQAWSDMISG